jgi:hypothetical protein
MGQVVFFFILIHSPVWPEMLRKKHFAEDFFFALEIFCC